MDADIISGWNDTINFLLVFVRVQPSIRSPRVLNDLQAGRFSAVMTSFLIETYVCQGHDAPYRHPDVHSVQRSWGVKMACHRDLP